MTWLTNAGEGWLEFLVIKENENDSWGETSENAKKKKIVKRIELKIIFPGST